MATESNKNKGKINRNTYRISGRRPSYGVRTLSGFTRTGRMVDEPDEPEDDGDEPDEPEPGTPGPCFAADEDSAPYNAAPPAADAKQGEREHEPQLPPLPPGFDFGGLSGALGMFVEGFSSALVEKPTTLATLLAGFAGHLAAKTDSERKPKGTPKIDTSRMEILVGMEDLAERLALIEDRANSVGEILELERRVVENIHNRQCQMERAIDKLKDIVSALQKDKKVSE